MSTTWLAVDENSYSHIVVGQNSYLHIVVDENSYSHNIMCEWWYSWTVKKLKIDLINLQYTEPWQVCPNVWKTGVRGITGYF